MISQWEWLISKNGSCELDIWPYLENMSRDVISRTSFGSTKRLFNPHSYTFDSPNFFTFNLSVVIPMRGS